MTEREKSMEEEIEALRKAGRDRERDLDTLNSVLQCNQDIINVRKHTHPLDCVQLYSVLYTHVRESYILTLF